MKPQDAEPLVGVLTLTLFHGIDVGTVLFNAKIITLTNADHIGQVTDGVFSFAILDAEHTHHVTIPVQNIKSLVWSTPYGKSDNL